MVLDATRGVFYSSVGALWYFSNTEKGILRVEALTGRFVASLVQLRFDSLCSSPPFIGAV